MHYLNLASLTTLLSTTTLASPTKPDWFTGHNNFGPYGKCLNQATAEYLVSGFAGLISNYSDANADALLADDGFTDTSDSINSLAQYPPGSVTFPSKAAFKAGQGAQQPVPLKVIAIDAVTCDTIAFRWTATPGPVPVKGINILVAVKTGSGKDDPADWQIKTVYSEFNSLVWWTDIGGGLVPPKSA